MQKNEQNKRILLQKCLSSNNMLQMRPSTAPLGPESMGPVFLTRKARSRGLQKASVSHILWWEEWCFFPFAREVSCWWFLPHSGFTLGCFHVFWHRFAPCSLLMFATSYYIQILYVNCFKDFRCFFFAFFVTRKTSFVQLHTSISLTIDEVPHPWGL